MQEQPEPEVLPYWENPKQWRHVELLEKVQQLPGYRAGDRELRVATLSRDSLISILMNS